MACRGMIRRPKPTTETFEFGPWTLTGVKSHILVSEGEERQSFESELRLPQLPEMVYDKNRLELRHATGFSLSFNALDALRLVDPECDLIKVAASREWLEARADCEFIKEVVKPFDWTFTTDYRGTVTDDNAVLKISETTDRIDIEKLKARERIHFFQDILLFEDELSDNGDSTLSVKIRVMPTSFFLLQRLYMRVDGVLVRVNDTRLYHQAGTNFILREFTTRESKFEDLKKIMVQKTNRASGRVTEVPLNVVTDKNEIWQHLPVVRELLEKLEFPEDSAESKAENYNSQQAEETS